MIARKIVSCAVAAMLSAICGIAPQVDSDMYNEFVPYHEEAVSYAICITKDVETSYEKYEIITAYVTKNYIYDYIRAIKLPKTIGHPDLDYVWNNQRGVCLDIASLTTLMLRAAGVKAWLCYGTVKGYPHAWVEAEIDGTKYIYDHEGETDQYKIITRF